MIGYWESLLLSCIACFDSRRSIPQLFRIYSVLLFNHQAIINLFFLFQRERRKERDNCSPYEKMLLTRSLFVLFHGLGKTRKRTSRYYHLRRYNSSKYDTRIDIVYTTFTTSIYRTEQCNDPLYLCSKYMYPVYQQVLDNIILEKPKSKEDAFNMLSTLSGRQHRGNRYLSRVLSNDALL